MKNATLNKDNEEIVQKPLKSESEFRFSLVELPVLCLTLKGHGAAGIHTLRGSYFSVRVCV